MGHRYLYRCLISQISFVEEIAAEVKSRQLHIARSMPIIRIRAEFVCIECDNYALGMLTADSGADLVNPAAWKKSPQPVFQQSPEAHVYATGHNGFFKSADGKQDWIIYHANSKPGQGCGWHRSPRAQPFSWNSDGTPNFGTPVPAGKPIPKP